MEDVSNCQRSLPSKICLRNFVRPDLPAARIRFDKIVETNKPIGGSISAVRELRFTAVAAGSRSLSPPPSLQCNEFSRPPPQLAPAPTGGRANKAIVHQLQFSGERVDFQKIQFCQLRLSERLRAVLVGSAVLLSQAAAVLCSFEC